VARERFPGMRAQVVLLSAVHALSEEARRLGVDRFLPKPFDLEDVARLAQELCDKAQGESSRPV
jgi:hypothetical protein